jgi:hypothetical protein
VVLVPATLATRLPEPGVKPLVVPRKTLLEVVVQGGFSGAAVQVKPMALEEEAVAARLVGPVGGTAVQLAPACVVAVACAEAAEVPSASTASTL